MPEAEPSSATEFAGALAVYEAAARTLIPLAARAAVESVVAVLPDAHTIEVHGSTNEDWLRVLRIQRVLDAHGETLFDVGAGHEDRAVEDAIDETNTEYLDLLIDLTGDDYVGRHALGIEP